MSTSKASRLTKKRHRRRINELQSDEKLTLNVGGYRHEIMASTIATSPDTRLFWTTQKKSQSPDYDAVTGEFYFDRNPLWFPYILNYYRLGKIHCPVDVCGAQFEEELQYWGIDECYIDSCCWDRYNKHKEANLKLGATDDIVEEIEHTSIYSDVENQLFERDRMPSMHPDASVGFKKGSVFSTCMEKFKKKYKGAIWTMLEEPNSCMAAKIIAFISLMFIVLSVTTFCLETLPEFEVRDSTQYKTIMVIEATCATWFTIEFFVRLFTCPNRIKFMKDIMNWIDLCAIIPFFISIGLPERVKTIVVLRVVRLIRVIRILKLSRHSFGLQILGHTLKASCRELCLLVFFLSIGVIIFSSLIYYAEKDVKNTLFTSIPTAFWWSIVTMTTIGYGDVVPQTFQGKFIGALCALCGVLVVALPVPVVVSNFSLYYSHAQSKLRSNDKNIKSNENNDQVNNFHMWFNPGVTHRSSMVSNASRNSWYYATPCLLSPTKPPTPQPCYDNYSPIVTCASWRSSLPNSPFFHSDMEGSCYRLERKLSMPGQSEIQKLNDDWDDNPDDMESRSKQDNELRIPGSKPSNAEHFDFSKDKVLQRRYQSVRKYSSQYLTPTPNSYHSSTTNSPLSTHGYWENPLSSTSGYSEQLTSSTTISPNSAIILNSKMSPNIMTIHKSSHHHNHRRRSSLFSEDLNSSPRNTNHFKESWNRSNQIKNLEEVSKKLESYAEYCEKERALFQLSSIENSSLCARRKARKSKDETVTSSANDLSLPTFTFDGPSDSSRESCSLKDESEACPIIPVSPKLSRKSVLVK